MKMENDQIMKKDKLEFSGITKEALELLFKNPKSTLMILLTSLPLFCFCFLNESIFQQALIGSFQPQAIEPPPAGQGIIVLIYRSSWSSPLSLLIEWVTSFVTPKIIKQSFTFLAVIHLFDLLNTIVTVSIASVIYAEGEDKEALITKPFITHKVGLLLKGPLLTSIYALLLTSLTLIGLLTLLVHIYIAVSGFWGFVDILDSISTLRDLAAPICRLLALIVLLVLFMALFTKHIEWGAVWDMGIVISILEENKQGDVALGVSAYLSRGSRRRGFLIKLVSFAWSFGLRLTSLYVGWQKGDVIFQVILGQVCLDCVGNAIKWVAFMVYYYDCKKRFLEKKFDGSATAAASAAEGRA